MKKNNGDGMREEYLRQDLGPGVRGKHLAAWRRGTNLVLLHPDVAKAFPDAESVNDALRFLLDAARRSVGRPRGKMRERGKTLSRRAVRRSKAGT
jgi:hypothetical protein